MNANLNRPGSRGGCSSGARAPGMTLLELTVVILVLLSLVSILMVGGTAWKKGSDRALCMMNLEAVQKGVRSYSNLYGYVPGDMVAGLESKVIGLGKFVEKAPLCPGDGTYSPGGNVIPLLGTLYITCSQAVDEKHEPADPTFW